MVTQTEQGKTRRKFEMWCDVANYTAGAVKFNRKKTPPTFDHEL